MAGPGVRGAKSPRIWRAITVHAEKLPRFVAQAITSTRDRGEYSGARGDNSDGQQTDETTEKYVVGINLGSEGTSSVSNSLDLVDTDVVRFSHISMHSAS